MAWAQSLDYWACTGCGKQVTDSLEQPPGWVIGTRIAWIRRDGQESETSVNFVCCEDCRPRMNQTGND